MSKSRKLNCIKCGKNFEVVASKINAKYCSRDCYNKHNAEYLFVKCNTCKIEFRTFPNEIKKGSGKFCSKNCRGIFNHNYAIENAKEIAELRFYEGIQEKTSLDKCWIWNKLKEKDGYGVMFAYGKRKLAHRFSYEIHQCKIPEGMLVCHRCDVPSCVNPSHLFLGSFKDNNRDRESKNRGAQIKGIKHPLSKLDEEKVLEIRKRLKDGHSIRNLAKEFNVHVANISKIKNRNIWSHI